MVWKPVSKLDYQPLFDKGQLLIVTCPMLKRDVSRWDGRAVAVVGDSGRYLRDVVRDLLANPQVRGVVFDGPACGRAAYDALWSGEKRPEWRIEEEHLQLVRQFVDLWDDDCGIKAPMQPFWPARIMYLEDQCG